MTATQPGDGPLPGSNLDEQYLTWLAITRPDMWPTVLANPACPPSLTGWIKQQMAGMLATTADPQPAHSPPQVVTPQQEASAVPVAQGPSWQTVLTTPAPAHAVSSAQP